MQGCENQGGGSDHAAEKEAQAGLGARRSPVPRQDRTGQYLACLHFSESRVPEPFFTSILETSNGFKRPSKITSKLS